MKDQTTGWSHNNVIFLISLSSLLTLDPRNIKMFVLDEADEMLSRGFKDQIYDVFRKMPSSIQVGGFNKIQTL